MAHISDQYVYAVMELILDEVPVTDVLAGLQRTLEAHRHSSLHSLVLTRLLRELPGRLAEHTPLVTVVSPESLAAYKDSIAAELATLTAPSAYNVTYDDSLIGGMVVQYKSTRVDSSYKHVLKNLYKNIITS